MCYTLKFIPQAPPCTYKIAPPQPVYPANSETIDYNCTRPWGIRAFAVQSASLNMKCYRGTGSAGSLETKSV